MNVNSQQMKTLLVYYSLTGNNKALAEKLSVGTQYDLLRLEEENRRTMFSTLLGLIFRRRPRLKKYDVDISTYDNVILIAPVWAGKVATPMESFIRRERQYVKAYSFITLCGGIAGQKEKLFASLSTLAGKEPVAIEELWVSDILSGQENGVGTYRIKDCDWGRFADRIVAFEDAVKLSGNEKQQCVHASVGAL